MAPEPTAPPVIVVVVTCDAGDWFDEALTGLAAQDYPNMSVLVVDAASEEDPTVRVSAVLPDAFVRRLEHRVPFGRAANEVLGAVDGASHYLLCHDDVVLAPDAVRLLVEEAFRSNAGIVTPKVVDWAEPGRLLAVGTGADRFGVVHPYVEPGELDQEQHDGVRDVFVAPSAATLVRADLFRALGGFDPHVADRGEDLDLSWRVQLAGARIVAAPSARVRHLAATDSGLRAQAASATGSRAGDLVREQHRLHTVWACYGLVHLVWMIPLTIAHALAESVGLALSGRSSEAGVPLRALAGTLVHPRRLVSARRRAQRVRRLSDRELRAMQTAGSARLRSWIRARADTGPDLPMAVIDPEAAAAVVAEDGEMSPEHDGVAAVGPSGAVPTGAGPTGETVATMATPGDWRPGVGAAAVVAALVVVGSRSLLGTLPVIGQLPSSAGGIGAWWHAWWSTWRPAGMGTTGPGAPGLGVLALLGTVLGASTGAAEHAVVLLPLVIGPLGAHRMARGWGSPRARAVAAVVYATVPVPYDALARGRWGGLVAAAAAPWVVAGVMRLAGTVPFPPTTVRGVAVRVVGLGAVSALVAAVAPSFVYVVVAIGLGVLLGSLLANSPGAGARSLAVATAAAVVAVVLLAPWSASVLVHRGPTFGVVPGPAARIGLGQLLHFHTGPIGNGVLGWGLVVAAGLPVALGRGWRLAWAARLWGVALVCTGLAWAGSRGWIPTPAPEVLLAPAGAALAGLVALGVVAFEMDLPGYRFGWRQLASGVAAAAVALAAVPVLQGAGNGRWYLPGADAGDAVQLAGAEQGDYRVLWVGAPAALPLPSVQLSAGVGWATSWDGLPDATDEFASAPGGTSATVAADLRLTSGRLTTRLGHLLAPLAVRFVIVPDHLAPIGSGAPAVAVPAALLAGLADQTDLQALPGGQGYSVYENAGWIPARATFATGTLSALPTGSAGERALQQLDLAGAAPALVGRPDGGAGDVPAGSTLYVASSPPGWQLRAGGRRTQGMAALGTGEVFPVPGTGGGPVAATLRSPSSGGDRAGQVVELAVWAAVGVLLVADRRRRWAAGPETVEPAWFTREISGDERRQRARRRSQGPHQGLSLGDAGFDDAEVWSGG